MCLQPWKTNYTKSVQMSLPYAINAKLQVLSHSFLQYPKIHPLSQKPLLLIFNNIFCFSSSVHVNQQRIKPHYRKCSFSIFSSQPKKSYCRWEEKYYSTIKTGLNDLIDTLHVKNTWYTNSHNLTNIIRYHLIHTVQLMIYQLLSLYHFKAELLSDTQDIKPIPEQHVWNCWCQAANINVTSVLCLNCASLTSEIISRLINENNL